VNLYLVPVGAALAPPAVEFAAHVVENAVPQQGRPHAVARRPYVALFFKKAGVSPRPRAPT